MPTKLTKCVVEGVKTKTKDAFLWDTEIAGFGVKVTRGGGRIYILQARFEGRKRRFTIGRHGSPWTERYAHLTEHPLRVAAESTSNEIAAALMGK